ncbi:hypothetical protein PG984_011975 [Apiospora sp. TS-2023a]
MLAENVVVNVTYSDLKAIAHKSKIFSTCIARTSSNCTYFLSGLADQQERQKKTCPRGILGIIREKRKRKAEEDGADGLDLTSRSSFTGSHRRLQGSASTVEEVVALIHRYRDEQPDGKFPADTTIIIKPDPLVEAASNRPIEDQRAPARCNKDKAITASPVAPSDEPKDNAGEPVVNSEV